MENSQNRYIRQESLTSIGTEGQKRLQRAKVLIVGCGGLGAPAALYLNSCGVGTLGLIDHDEVSLSNLHRQVLYSEQDLERPKVLQAKKRLQEQNIQTQITTYAERLTSTNAKKLFQAYDLVIDGSDNLPTRNLINQTCVALKKPFVYGSVLRFEGQLSVIDPGRGPCYRCLYPHSPEPGQVPNCSEAGVLGSVPGVIGTLQATEALKFFLNIGDDPVGKLTVFHALQGNFQNFFYSQKENCQVCSQLVSAEAYRPLSVQELKQKLSQKPLLLDVREPHEYELAHLDSLLIPLGSLGERWKELQDKKDQEIIVYCHHGIRSAHACEFLAQKGFKHLKNLTGGIDQWSKKIDPTLPRY